MNTIINISDHPVTGLKRKVQWRIFNFNDQDKFVNLYTTVSHYENNGGEYGDKVSSRAVSDFERILVANNDRRVNPLNGLRCSVNENEEWVDPLGTIVPSPVPQYDFFVLMIQNPVNIPTLIAGIILQEDQVYSGFN